MTPEQKQGRATYRDILALPDHVVGQIVDGELIVSPRPAGAHAQASSTLGMDVGGAFHRGRGGPGGWWILDEPELHFGEDVLVPDLAGWRRERMPAVTSAPYITLTPDWVCEVLSPSTAGLDRVRKLRIYAREGVPFVWLVDPAGRTLETLKRHGDQWIVSMFAHDEKVRAEPFEAMELELGALWLLEHAGG